MDQAAGLVVAVDSWSIETFLLQSWVEIGRIVRLINATALSPNTAAADSLRPKFDRCFDYESARDALPASIPIALLNHSLNPG